MRRWVTIAAALLLAMSARSRAHTIIADSVADWGVSSAQGYNGWYYGYYDGTSAFPYTNNPGGDDFNLMTQFNPTTTDFQWWHQNGSGGYYTMVGQGIQHPNGTQANHAGRLPALEYSVRRWVSDYAGPIDIEGHISMGGGQQAWNGVSGYILVDGVQIYDQRVLSGNQTGFDYEVCRWIDVGTVIDFVVDPGPLLMGSWNDLFDTTKFTALITEMVPGDANHDHAVDGLDYIVWADNFGASTTDGHDAGDFNCDGVVDGLDYVIWADNFGFGSAALPHDSFSVAAVPEPATWSLALIGLVGLSAAGFFRRRTMRSRA